MQISQEPVFIQVNAKDYSAEHYNVVEENLIRLPFYFNENSEPFIGFEHLNSLYRESYFCILHGNYHAGIIVMSQLIEETLREIVHVHTGNPDGSAFEGLLSAMSRKSRVTFKPYLIHPEIVNQLIKIKEEIRNPYTHLRYKKILKGKKISAAKIPLGSDPENLVENIKNGVEAVKEGKLAYKEYDPSKDPVMASLMKQEIDKDLAIMLAWKIYPLHWFLMEEYLNLEITNASVKMFGSVWEPMPKKGK